MKLTIERAGQQIELSLTPKLIERDGKKVGQIGIGPAVVPEIPADMKTEYQYPVIAGLLQSGEKVWRNSILTLKMMGKLVSGQVSLKNLSGPINIAVYAGYSASAGLARFLDFLAIVSISLGVINLLPIPVLDGGHLTFFTIEAIRGRPLNERVIERAQQVGVALLLTLMVIVTTNDIWRAWGSSIRELLGQ